MHPSITHPPVHPSTHHTLCPLTDHPFTHIYIITSIHPGIHPSSHPTYIHPFDQSSILQDTPNNPFIHRPIHPSIHPTYIYRFNQSSIHPSVHLSINIPIHLFIHPSSIWPSVLPWHPPHHVIPLHRMTDWLWGLPFFTSALHPSVQHHPVLSPGNLMQNDFLFHGSPWPSSTALESNVDK